MLVRCFAGEAYRKSCYGPAGNTQTDEYGRQQFRLATAIAWAPGRPSKTTSEVMLVEAQRRANLPQQLTAAQLAYTELWMSASCPQTCNSGVLQEDSSAEGRLHLPDAETVRCHEHPRTTTQLTC